MVHRKVRDTLFSGKKPARESTATVGDKRFPILNVLPAIQENCIGTSLDKEPNYRKSRKSGILGIDMDPEKWVIIDVGGERFQAKRIIFLAFPGTRLGKLMNAESVDEIMKYCEEFVPGDPPEFFFDRNPETFPGVLDMYRTGNFHFPEGGRSCAFVMRRDFEYWGLDELDMEACCALKYYPEIEVCRLQKEGDEMQNMKEQKAAALADFGPGRIAKIRTWMWETFEKPWSSNFAKHYACFSLLIVIVSTVTFVISTSEEVQVHGTIFL